MGKKISKKLNNLLNLFITFLFSIGILFLGIFGVMEIYKIPNNFSQFLPAAGIALLSMGLIMVIIFWRRKYR